MPFSVFVLRPSLFLLVVLCCQLLPSSPQPFPPPRLRSLCNYKLAGTSLLEVKCYPEVVDEAKRDPSDMTYSGLSTVLMVERPYKDGGAFRVIIR